MNRSFFAAGSSFFGFCILFASCVHRQPVLPEQDLLADSFIHYASPNPNGSSSVSFVLGGKQVYVDPVMESALAETLPEADLILVTHVHKDHYSKETVKAVSGPRTRIAGIPRLVADFPDAIPLLPGETAEVDGLRIETRPAWNSSHSRLTGDLAFTVSDGSAKVFISGDTDMHDEYLTVRGVDVAVMYIYPPATLPVADALKLAKVLKPAVIIPVHWPRSIEDTIKEFADKAGKRSEVRILELRRE